MTQKFTDSIQEVKNISENFSQDGKKPWLKPNGKHKSVDQIRRICAEWTPSIWEKYLESLEKDLKEELIDEPSEIENSSQGLASFVFSETREYPHLRELFELATRALSKREFQILQMLYGENDTETEIAKKLELDRSTVRVLIKRGHKKIRELIESGRIQKHLQFIREIGLPLSPFCHLFEPIYRGECRPAEYGPSETHGKEPKTFTCNEPMPQEAPCPKLND